MKKLYACALLLVTGWYSVGIAQDSAASAIIEKDVKAADTAMWEAVNACDEARWSRLVADDVTLIIIGGTLFDKTKLRGDFFGTTMHPVPCDTQYSNEPMQVRSNGNLAVVTGNVEYHGNGKGRPRGSSRLLFTRVYEKREGRWQFVHGQHTSTKERQAWPPK